MTEIETRTGEKVSSEGPLATSVERLRREFDRWTDAVMTRGGQALDVLWSGEGQGLVLDVLESPDEVTVLADLPGVDPASIDVTLTGNMLTITAQRSVPERAGQTVHLQQRCSGRFTRSVPMPSPINPDAISADARNGVLKIRLPKAERAKPRHIRVQPAGEECTPPVI